MLFEYNYSTPSRYVAIDTYSADFTHFYLGKNSSRNMMYMANGFLLNSTYTIIDQFGGIIYMEKGNHPVSAFSGIRISMVSGNAAQISEKINGTILAPGNYSISIAPNSSISEDSLNVSLSVLTNPYGISEHLNLTLDRKGTIFIADSNLSLFTEIVAFSSSLSGKMSLHIVQASST